MNRRKNPLFEQGAIQVKFHVPGSFELLKNHLIHSALGFDQGGRQNGQTSTLFYVSGGSEEFLWLQQRLGLDPARHNSTFSWLERVVATGQSSNAIEQDN